VDPNSLPAPEVTISEAAAAIGAGAVLIDVREPVEYNQVRVPQARSMPLGEVLERIGELNSRERLYVICALGGRSMAAAGALRQAGFDAVSVAGGTSGWEAEGREVVLGPA